MYYVMTDNYYWHSKGRVILFETIEETQGIVQAFFSYAMDRKLAEQGPGGIIQVMQAQGITHMEQYKNESMATITWAELQKERAATSRSN